MEASYRVKIEGRLLDSKDEEAEQPMPQDAMTEEEKASGESVAKQKTAEKPRFSHFFKSLTVDFDRSRFRTGNEQTVEWKKPDASARNQTATSPLAAADFDELTFKRNGDENQNITINLFRQESPERYQLSPELADVVDMKDATHQEAVMGLWEYIKLLGLQEDEEKRNFRCNEPLKKVSLFLILAVNTILTLNTGHKIRRYWSHPAAQRLRPTAPSTSRTYPTTVHHPS